MLPSDQVTAQHIEFFCDACQEDSQVVVACVKFNYLIKH